MTQEQINEQLKAEIKELRELMKLMAKGLEDVDNNHKGVQFWEAYNELIDWKEVSTMGGYISIETVIIGG